MKLKYWHDGREFRLAIIVEERRSRMDVILPGLRKVRTMPRAELELMRDVDAGPRQIRKARASLRRLTKGSSKRFRAAVRRALL